MPDELAIDVHGMTKRFGASRPWIILTFRSVEGKSAAFSARTAAARRHSSACCAGCCAPDEGEGSCLGYDVITESEAIKRQVGYMTQSFSF